MLAGAKGVSGCTANLPSLKSKTGRIARAAKIAVSVSRQHSICAITKTTGSTMVKNNV